MKIKFNSVTWYSQIIAIILGVAIFYIGFYIGKKKGEIGNSPHVETIPEQELHKDGEHKSPNVLEEQELDVDVKTHIQEEQLRESLEEIKEAYENQIPHSVVELPVTISGGNEESENFHAADILAIVVNGEITGFTIVDSGSEYISEPTIVIPGFESVKTKIVLENGSVKNVKIVQ